MTAPRPANHFTRIPRIALIGAGYLAVYVLLSLAATSIQLFPGRNFWSPGSGLSLALLYVYGPGYAPLVFVAVLVSATSIFSLPLSAAILGSALLSALLYSLAAGVLRRVANAGPLQSLRDMARFILVALIAPALLALTSVNLMKLEGTVSPLLYSQTLFQFWVSETLGNLVAAPFLIFALRLGQRDVSAQSRAGRPGRWIALAQAVTLAAALWIVFGLNPGDDRRMWYLLFLPLIWVALEFGLPGATVAILAITTGCYLVVPLYHYPLTGFEDLQVFLLLIALIGQVAGAAFTERWQAEKTLRRRLRLEENITAISTRFIDLGARQIDCEISAAIQSSGEICGAEAGQLFLFSRGDDSFQRFHQWRPTGALPDASAWVGARLEDFPWLQARVLNGEVIVIHSVDAMPRAATVERDFLSANGVQSALFLPIHQEKHLSGLLCLLTSSRVHTWETEDAGLLTLLGELLLGVLDRRRSDELLRESNNKFRSVVLQSYDGILLIDDQARVIEWNRGMERISGLRRPDVLGRLIWEVQQQLAPHHIRGPLLKEKLARMAELFREEGPASWANRLSEQIIERPDGSRRSVQTLVFQIRNGQPRAAGAILRDVTETRQGEEALQRSRSRLAEAGRLARLGHFEIEIPSGRMEWSEEAYRIFDWPTDKPPPNLLRQTGFFHPDDRPMILQRIEEVVNLKQTFDFEYRVRIVGGGYKTLHTIGQPLLNASGEVISVFGTVMDITAMKQVETDLRESQERYKELADSISDVFFALDCNQRITYWNRASESLTGVSASQAAGRPLYDLLPRLKGTSVEQFIQEASRTRQHQSFVMEYRIRDKKHYLEVNAYPSDQGLSVFIRDVTERQQADLRLRQSEARYRAVVDDQTDLICRFTPDGTITFVNEAYCRAFNLRKRNLVGRKYTRLNAQIDAPEQGRLASSLGADARPITYSCQARLSDGQLHWILWSERPIFNAPGRLVEYQSVGRDISESKHLEEELRYLSTHDALTHLYNRSFFETEINRLQRSRLFPISVLIADVNGLKATNDSQGHPAGDDLLRRTAQVLSVSFRPEDMVARFGGDEFAVLLPGTDAVSASEVLKRVRASLESHNRANKGEELSLSLGIATAEKGQSLLEVLSLADERMYVDKMRQKLAP